MEKNSGLENRVVAMSNTLAKKSTELSVLQQKILYVSLAVLYKDGRTANGEVKIKKTDLFDKLDIKDVSGQQYKRLRGEFSKLMMRSGIQFGTDEEFLDGFLIASTRADRFNYYVGFTPVFLPLLDQLSGNFVRLLENDLVSFDSKYSMMLYQHLLVDKWKLASDDFRAIRYTTKELKKYFGQSEGDYTSADSKTKKERFNRTLWEKKTILKAVDEINRKSKCINVLTCKKIKRGNRVYCYEFKFLYTDPQQIVSEEKSKKRRKKREKARKEGIGADVARGQSSLDDYFDDDVKKYDWLKEVAS